MRRAEIKNWISFKNGQYKIGSYQFRGKPLFTRDIYTDELAKRLIANPGKRKLCSNTQLHKV